MNVACRPGIGAVVFGHQRRAADVPAVGEDLGVFAHDKVVRHIGLRWRTDDIVTAAIGEVIVTGQSGQVSGLGSTVLVEDDGDVLVIGSVAHLVVGETVDFLRGKARQGSAAPGCRQSTDGIPGVQEHVAGRLAARVAHIDVIGVNRVGLNQRGHGIYVSAVKGEHHIIGTAGIYAECGVIAWGVPRVVTAKNLETIGGACIQMNVACRPSVGAIVLGHQRLAADIPPVREYAGVFAHNIVVDRSRRCSAYNIESHVGYIQGDGHGTRIHVNEIGAATLLGVDPRAIQAHFHIATGGTNTVIAVEVIPVATLTVTKGEVVIARSGDVIAIGVDAIALISHGSGGVVFEPAQAQAVVTRDVIGGGDGGDRLLGYRDVNLLGNHIEREYHIGSAGEVNWIIVVWAWPRVGPGMVLSDFKLVGTLRDVHIGERQRVVHTVGCRHVIVGIGLAPTGA